MSARLVLLVAAGVAVGAFLGATLTRGRGVAGDIVQVTVSRPASPACATPEAQAREHGGGDLITNEVRSPGGDGGGSGEVRTGCKSGVQWSDPKVTRGRYAYATMVQDDKYCEGTIVWAYDLLVRHPSELGADVVVLLVKGLSVSEAKCVAPLRSLGAIVKWVERLKAEAGSGSQWQWTFSKFRAWQMLEYDRVVMTDSDLFWPDRNGDLLFGYDELAAPYRPKPDNAAVFSSGLFVVRPSEETFEDILAFSRSKSKFMYPGDLGVLNEWALARGVYVPLPPGAHVSRWNHDLLYASASKPGKYLSGVHAVHLTTRKPFGLSREACCKESPVYCDWYDHKVAALAEVAKRASANGTPQQA